MQSSQFLKGFTRPGKSEGFRCIAFFFFMNCRRWTKPIAKTKGKKRKFPWHDLEALLCSSRMVIPCCFDLDHFPTRSLAGIWGSLHDKARPNRRSHDRKYMRYLIDTKRNVPAKEFVDASANNAWAESLHPGIYVDSALLKMKKERAVVGIGFF